MKKLLLFLLLVTSLKAEFACSDEIVDNLLRPNAKLIQTDNDVWAVYKPDWVIVNKKKGTIEIQTIFILTDRFEGRGEKGYAIQYRIYNTKQNTVRIAKYANISCDDKVLEYMYERTPHRTNGIDKTILDFVKKEKHIK